MARNAPAPSEFMQDNGLPRGEVIGHFDRYAKAQEMVDYLADKDFPVRAVTIVGNDLVSVEQVRGKLTYARVALNAAMQGAVFGLFIGFIMALFSPTDNMFGQILTTMGIGIGMWVLFGVISYAMTGGKRDFISTKDMIATSFDVVCAFNYVGEAKNLLKDLPGYRPYTPPAPKPAAGAGQSAPQAQQPQAERASGRFPDLPDGRPQFGVRIDDQQQEQTADQRPDSAETEAGDSENRTQ
ncbi:general stress protein [Micrococcoides hystricis]|uniref:General stress protein n=1 Tax=Micrococcoides hystricis TaxID=1572761 RepID=A0ABV6P8D0_9MICC